MTPDVVVDVGNSRVKWGRVAAGGIGVMAAFPHDDTEGWDRQLSDWGGRGLSRWAVAGVHPRQIARFRAWLDAWRAEAVEITTPTLLSRESRLDFRVAVREPQAVGVDRLLTALAARQRPASAARPVAAVTVGTAVTVDFVRPDGEFVGGAILPGPRLMARSLHEYTAQLPQIEIAPAAPERPWGADTREAIAVGIAAAVLGSADYLIRDWAGRWAVPPQIYVTGGDGGYFRGFRSPAAPDGVEIVPELTLDGIRIVAGVLP